MPNDEGGCLMTAIVLGTIGISIIAGIMAWDWVDPDGFFGFVGFLMLWSVLSYIGHFIAGGIATLIFDR